MEPMPHSRDNTARSAEQSARLNRPWSALPTALAFVGLLLGIVAIHRLAPVEIQLTVDGQTVLVVTRAGTVSDLLLEHDVRLLPGDLVLPGPSSRLRDGDEVLVQRARPVVVRADGRTLTLYSHGRSAQAILSEAGVVVGPTDKVKVNGALWPIDEPPERLTTDRRSEPRADDPIAKLAVAGPGAAAARGSPRGASTKLVSQGAPADEPAAPSNGPEEWQIEVLRSKPVTVVEDGIPYEQEVAGGTVAEALQWAGIVLYPEDQVHPPADSRVSGGMQIHIWRATPFTVEADGTTRQIRAWADTVGAALERSGIELKGRDYSIPPEHELLSSDMHVQVVRVLEDILVREVSIPFGTITQPDPAMDLDTTEVLRPGVPGLKRQRIRIIYENGEEISRNLEEEVGLREPVTELLAYGTNIVWRTIDTPEGPKRYWRHMRVYATSYSLSRSGTPESAPWYGRTWLGLPMRKGIVAVDPRYVPLSTNLYVPGYGIGFSGDTGGGIRRYHIDLGFDDDNYESWHQMVDLYLLEPLPGEVDMVWLVPE